MSSAHHDGEPLAARARAALHPVLDPELGLSIVELGLVADARREDGALVVEIMTTSPACPMRETLHEAARGALAAAFPEDAIEVRASDEAWSPARLGAAARRALGWEDA